MVITRRADLSADKRASIDAPEKSEQRVVSKASFAGGKKVWATWHAHALHAEFDERWIELNVTKRLPCGECRRHFLRLLVELPPMYGVSGWDYFGWTVAIHNAVNTKLGKRIVSTLEARALWQNATAVPAA